MPSPSSTERVAAAGIPQGIGRIALGLWPIAGVSTMGVSATDAQATIEAAIDHGIDTFDSAYSYGYDGESDRVLGRVADSRRDQIVWIGKVGTHYDSDRQRRVDGSPQRLRFEAEDSLCRSGLKYFDALLLHQPDPRVPIAQSAEALKGLLERGLTRSVGVSNASIDELEDFARVVPPAFLQLPVNLVQRQSTASLRTWCVAHGVKTQAYWVLMKGLLADRIPIDHRFPPGDSRPKYAIFQNPSRQRTERLLEHLRQLAGELRCSVSQLVVAATLRQPGVDTVLLGAHRPEQIIETAGARSVILSDDHLGQIEEWLQARGDDPIY
jgi:aryl-alcohol dehydrogenase-like predicted oxidoreductase